jgi:hypothetical protein
MHESLKNNVSLRELCHNWHSIASLEERFALKLVGGVLKLLEAT